MAKRISKDITLTGRWEHRYHFRYEREIDGVVATFAIPDETIDCYRVRSKGPSQIDFDFLRYHLRKYMAEYVHVPLEEVAVRETIIETARLAIPSVVFRKKEKKVTRPDLLLFIDTSGSVQHYISTFFKFADVLGSYCRRISTYIFFNLVMPVVVDISKTPFGDRSFVAVRDIVDSMPRSTIAMILGDMDITSYHGSTSAYSLEIEHATVIANKFRTVWLLVEKGEPRDLIEVPSQHVTSFAAPGYLMSRLRTFPFMAANDDIRVDEESVIEASEFLLTGRERFGSESRRLFSIEQWKEQK